MVLAGVPVRELFVFVGCWQRTRVPLACQWAESVKTSETNTKGTSSIFLKGCCSGRPPESHIKLTRRSCLKWQCTHMGFDNVEFLTWRNRRLPSSTRINLSVCTCLQIRYWAENCTGPTDLVNYSSKSWIHMNRESEILRNKVHKEE